MKITPGDVLNQTAWCSARRQGEQALIYNARTDELHVISLEGLYILQLCDGLKSVEEILILISDSKELDNLSVQTQLFDYINNLVERGVLQRTYDP